MGLGRRLTLVNDLPLDDVPEKALGAGIHSGGGLVQHHDGGAAHQRDTHTQLALVSARV